jgi:hypothetical protein
MIKEGKKEWLYGPQRIMGVSEFLHETLLRIIARTLYTAHHKDHLHDNYYLLLS